MRSLFKKLWSDPVWSRVIGSAIYAILTGSLAGIGILWARANSWSASLVVLVLVPVLGIETLSMVIYLRRSRPLVVSEVRRPVYYYKRSYRRIAAAAALVLPITSLAAYFVWEQVHCRPDREIVILVADFESKPELGSFRMTRMVFNRLQAALKPYLDTRVELMGRPIDWKEGSDAALTRCEKRRAAIVIWGDYDRTHESVAVNIHFDVIRHREDDLAGWTQAREGKYAVGDLEHFMVQDQISKQLAYAGLFVIGLTRFQRGDYESAIARFTDALKESEDSSPNPAYFFRARALREVGRSKDAIEDYTRVVESDERYPHALTNRGALRIEGGDAVGAVLDLTRAIEVDPTDSLAYNNRGGAFYSLRMYAESLADYESAIKISPKDSLSYVGRGNANDRLGNFSKAISDYEFAIKLNPRQPTAYLNRGIALLHNGDIDPAIKDFSRTIQLQPDFVEAYRARALCYKREGRRDDAIRDYRSALAAAQSLRLKEELEDELKDLQREP